MIVYNYDADLEVSDTGVRSSLLGAWHFFEFASLGAPFPHLTLDDFGPRDPDKFSFCSGAIAPHLGEI